VRFMLLRKADEKTEAGVLPGPELLQVMGKYVEEMVKAGVMLDGAGLKDTSKGVRVSFKGGKPLVTDGPFPETKELVAGYCIIKVNSKAEAIEWVKKWPREDGDITIEVREFFEAEDFGSKS
jgi:hypothetical protein